MEHGSKGVGTAFSAELLKASRLSGRRSPAILNTAVLEVGDKYYFDVVSTVLQASMLTALFLLRSSQIKVLCGNFVMKENCRLSPSCRMRSSVSLL